MKDPSPVQEFVILVRENCAEATSHSWERISHAMRHALRLLIGAGFKFTEDDVSLLAKRTWWGYAVGESAEWFYSMAIREGNFSAAASYEAMKGRKPFIADDVDLGDSWGGTFCHMVGNRVKERLAEGFSFTWKGQKVTVTSFAADGQYLIACSYKKRGQKIHHKTNPARRIAGIGAINGENVEVYNGPKKIDKRYRITREDIIADRSERKKRAKLVDQAKELAAAAGVKDLPERLGFRPGDHIDTLPVARLEKVIAELEGLKHAS